MMYGHGEPSWYRQQGAQLPPAPPPNRHEVPPRYHHRVARPPRNGSKTVNFVLRICTVMLALTSGVVMSVSIDCLATAAPSSSVATVTFTYKRFRAFKLLVACNFTAVILAAAALCLQLQLLSRRRGGDEEETRVSDVEEEESGIGVVEIMLVVVDLLVLALLYSATTPAFIAAADYNDQIGVCAKFSGNVSHANFLSLAASIAVTLSIAARLLPLPFNVPCCLV